MWGDKKRLCKAAANGDEATVSKLLQRGADPNGRGKTGRTPLTEAARNGDLHMVGLLLDAGAKIDEEDLDGTTPLGWAIRMGHSDVMMLLVKRGADINRRGSDGRTPVMNAIWERKPVGMIKALLDMGANPSMKYADGVTLLDFAEHTKDNEVIELVKSVTPAVNPRDSLAALGAQDLAELTFPYYLETFALVAGYDMTPVRQTMARILLDKRPIDEIIAFCSEMRAAVERGEDPNLLVKQFLRFENPELATGSKE